MRVLIAWTAALGLLTSSASFAQTYPGNIPSTVHLLVEDLQPDDAACGITSEAIESAARSSLRYNRITELDDSLSPTLYIRFNTFHFAAYNLCVSTIEISLRTYHYVKPHTLENTLMLPAIMCSSGSTVPGPPATFRRVFNDMKDGIDDCLSKLIKKKPRKL